MRNLLSSFIKRNKNKRLSPKEREQLAFENHAREQFKRLKEKGLSISVFTL
ncbi:MAG: hypothetical protein NUV98_06830 [Candidatus Roizmanbacteria bacterium]|nr:hypothetical protein [Candidatus Roizmanbacteria bacterium]